MQVIKCFVLFALLVSLIHALPHATIEHLTPASILLQKLFDQLIAYDHLQARYVLDQALISVPDLEHSRRHLDEMIKQLRESHLNNCQNVELIFRRGRNGADLLQLLIVDHLVLATSNKEERAFILELMFSIYLHDVATPTEFPDIPWNDDAMAALMMEHATMKKYNLWHDYLSGAIEE